MPAWTERDWDHERDHHKHEPRASDIKMNARQKVALAKLIGGLEGIISFGLLEPESELECRKIVAEALAAFGLPSIAEIRGGVQ